MKHRKIIGLIALVMLLACVTTIPVLAQQPCQFKGTVTLDGASVAAGIPITAELTDGTPVGSTTAYLDGGVSKYNMIVPQVGGVPAEGATLKFYVNGYLGGTSTWNTGANKDLNLAAATDGATYTLTVTVSPTGKGTVNKNPNMAQYPAGTVVTLTATAIGGWDFDQWSGTNNNAINPTTVTMNANKSVTAHFEQEAVSATFASWLYETFVECL